MEIAQNETQVGHLKVIYSGKVYVNLIINYKCRLCVVKKPGSFDTSFVILEQQYSSE